MKGVACESTYIIGIYNIYFLCTTVSHYYRETCFKLATCVHFRISDFGYCSVYTKPSSRLVIMWSPKTVVRWLRLQNYGGFWDFRFRQRFRDFSQDFQRFQPEAYEISRSEQPLGPSCPFWEQLTNMILAWLWEWLWTKANLDWSETQWCLEPYLQSVCRCVHRVAILGSWIY